MYVFSAKGESDSKNCLFRKSIEVMTGQVSACVCVCVCVWSMRSSDDSCGGLNVTAGRTVTKEAHQRSHQNMTSLFSVSSLGSGSRCRTMKTQHCSHSSHKTLYDCSARKGQRVFLSFLKKIGNMLSQQTLLALLFRLPIKYAICKN